MHGPQVHSLGGGCLWNIREGPYPFYGVEIYCCGWGQLPKPGSEPGLDVSLGKSTPICVYEQ